MANVVAMPVTVPTYVPSDILTGDVRADAMRIMRRLAEHVRNGTTDQAPGTFEEPIDNYLDEDLFAAEIELLFKQIPLPLALSCELPSPNTYKAMDAAGVPVIITRDASGDVHAMVNVCRHRGAAICGDGYGEGRALTCPYHAWSYGMDGQLRGIYGEATFGDVSRVDRSLTALPVEERHGVIFVGLTTDLTWDLDAWLGEFDPILASLKLDECVLFSSRQMPGPNWKVVVDGYLEGYHFAALHAQTVNKINHSNIATFEPFGPHQRVSFALRTIDNVLDDPEETWEPAAHVGAINWIFPGLSLAGGWRDRIAVSLPLPTARHGETITEQRIVVRKEAADAAEEHELEIMRDWFYDVVYDEDYLTGFGVQKGLAATAGGTQVFGRNEPGVQHLHRTINRLMTENHRPGYPLPREHSG
jgi:nitrite reductase/ring-hydroxylating ferredoxin subunit